MKRSVSFSLRAFCSRPVRSHNLEVTTASDALPGSRTLLRAHLFKESSTSIAGQHTIPVSMLPAASLCEDPCSGLQSLLDISIRASSLPLAHFPSTDYWLGCSSHCNGEIFAPARATCQITLFNWNLTRFWCRRFAYLGHAWDISHLIRGAPVHPICITGRVSLGHTQTRTRAYEDQLC